MRLDPDLVRSILLRVQDLPANESMKGQLTVEGYDQDTVWAHIELLAEAGYLDAKVIKGNGGRIIGSTINRLTWDGHEFIGKAKELGLWNRAKSLIVAKGGAVTIQILSGVLTQLAKQAVGIDH